MDEITRNAVKHFIKYIIIFSVILAMLGAISLTFKYYRDKKLIFIASSVSPDSKYEVVLHQRGAWTAVSPFGPSNVKVSLKDKESNKTLEEVFSSIANDGAALYEDNWTVVWYEKQVEVTLHGCEQEDELYILDLNS